MSVLAVEARATGPTREGSATVTVHAPIVGADARSRVGAASVAVGAVACRAAGVVLAPERVGVFVVIAAEPAVAVGVTRAGTAAVTVNPLPGTAAASAPAPSVTAAAPLPATAFRRVITVPPPRHRTIHAERCHATAELPAPTVIADDTPGIQETLLLLVA